MSRPLSLIMLAAAGVLLNGCAHKPASKGLLPVDLIGDDWIGSIRGRTLVIDGARESLRVSPAEHVVDGPILLLVNSPTDEGRYVSTSTRTQRCEVRGRVFPLTFSLCLKTKGDQECLYRLQGCAEPARS
ncbi:hypothetical protein P7B02_08490 [Caulobacter segnis]|uniref:hypothetical protein n=1 Tax=Caulobacter segnis TaxID=88688 RepID=UPI002410261A|nr:hypothetical protein [Caulobacter segnis]MDG2521578.1 hypothetical protein [Caulobacter segnis]